MKKLIVLAVLVAACSGCGRGWLPLFRGDSCTSCASPALPPAPATCNGGCAPGYSSSYAGIEGESYSGSGYYDNGQYMGSQYMGDTVLSETVVPGIVGGGAAIPPARATN